MKVVMKLSPEAIVWCRTQGALRMEAHEKRMGCRNYGHNNVGSNVLGVKGELGAYHYLLAKGPKDFQFVPKFTSVAGQMEEPDIVLFPNIVIEVKSIRPHSWLDLGRMITPRHLKKYLQNNAIVIWAAAYPQDSADKVDLHGWNYATEVRDYGIPKKTVCPNIWLEDPARVRPMETIFEHLKAAASQAAEQKK